jgi:hypothetical protein
MSRIKDEKNAKGGLNALFGSTEAAGQLQPLEDRPLASKEEIEETLGEDTRGALRQALERRQYLKAGRPPKGSSPKQPGYTRMTFIVSPEKQESLREIALREGLFLRELLEEGIDMIIAKYGKEERI